MARPLVIRAPGFTHGRVRIRLRQRLTPLPGLVFADRRATPIRPVAERALTLADGRRLGVAEFGPRNGPPLVYLHGFLGSRLEPGIVEEHRVPILSFDRPSYGLSDPQPEPSLAAFGRDVAEALGQLGVDACSIVGASAGAPYAIAAASALGHRCHRLFLCAGLAGLPVLGEAGGAARLLFRLAHPGPRGRLFHQLFKAARLLGVDRTLVGVLITEELRSIRRLGLTPPFVHERMLQSLRTGIDSRADGILADARLLTRPWDVDPGTLLVPTTVFHGRRDEVVPPEHAGWYVNRLPKAELRLNSTLRHLSTCFASAETVEAAALAAAA